MELEIKRSDEVTLPNNIHQLGLTLEEIGAIVFIACAKSTGRFDGDLPIGPALKSLKDKGVFKVAKEGNTLRLGLDLTELQDAWAARQLAASNVDLNELEAKLAAEAKAASPEGGQ